MNKTALRTFAKNARRELLDKVKAKAMKVGITDEKIKQADVESSDAVFIDGKQLSSEEKKQRDNLIKKIEQKGFNQVMEEVAYTWFNRLTALRYMEVNEYLPSNVRVLSSSNSSDPIPDIIKEAMSLDFDIDKEWIYEMRIKNQNDKLFQYMIIKQCNDLYYYMPFVFEKIDDYSEILFPEGLLSKSSFLKQMTDVHKIPENDWSNVEIIGWLYQFYISEEKDRVFKMKKKYKTEEIPYATQLFTPDWIVKYMVQNSLGRYWIENHIQDKELSFNWDFYIDDNKYISVSDNNGSIFNNAELNVEDIKCFDPAMGSGHILVYMFDVLYEIYLKNGYLERDIPRLIIENNLFGLDIDTRAYQLACFSLVMKALEYNRRFLRSIKYNKLTLNLASFQESNGLNHEDLSYLVGEEKGQNFEKIKSFLTSFNNAKTLGSLIKIEELPLSILEKRIETIKNSPTNDLFLNESRERLLDIIPLIIKQAKIMSNRYDVLVTNPPYMGYGSMNTIMTNYLKEEYPDSKSDLFACFMELNQYLKPNGFYASINQHSWMFLSSFKKLRQKIIKDKTIENLLHLGPRTFEEIGGEVVQSTAFVLRNNPHQQKEGLFVRLVDERTALEKKEKLLQVVRELDKSVCYVFNQDNFKNIPESPIAYWVQDSLLSVFAENNSLSNNFEVRNGITTGENNRFIRYWYEVGINRKTKWFPCNKGGAFRKWYGNNDFVIDWEEDGHRLKTFKDKNGRMKATLRSIEFNFKEAITMSRITTSGTSYRWLPEGFITEGASNNIYFYESSNIEQAYKLIGLLNTKLSDYIMSIYNPTINVMPNDIRNFPVRIEKNDHIIDIVKENIDISKRDWDTFELSRDFKRHPLVQFKTSSEKIEDAFTEWSEYAKEQFKKLKNNEEELNEIFIDIYGLHDKLSPHVDEKRVTIRKADIKRDIKNFISYAIGCLFGRYSPKEDGIIYAGGDFDIHRYSSHYVDKDNILPVLDGAYFKDDIVTLLINFVKTMFGNQKIEENLDFISNALGKKKNETPKETIRRYIYNDFYKDHLKIYKKKPIYWMFTSGKERAFNCLIYMHRYDSTTLGRIRTDYLHELQTRMDAEKEALLNVIEGDSMSKEITQAKKELKSLENKIEELKDYDEVLHHMADQQIEIDLDDGVDVNYEKFKDLLAKK